MLLLQMQLIAAPTLPWGDLLTLAISGIAGALGGFMASINICSPNEIYFGFSAKKVKLGSFGDMLIGFAAGMAVLILSGSTGHAAGSFHAVPLGLLAGIAGNRLLFGMSNAILGRVMSDQEELRDKVDRIDKVTELITEGEKLLERGNPRAAEELFRQALGLDSRNPLAHLDLAKSYRHQADELPASQQTDFMKMAIQSLSTSIETSPRYDRAYYNRACYRAITGESPRDVLSDLRQALELFPGNRQLAVADPDFEPLRNNNAFNELLNEFNGN